MEVLHNTLENLTINHLKMNSRLVKTDSTNSKDSMDFWHEVESIAFDPESKISSHTFKILSVLKSLDTVDLNTLNSSYDITMQDIEVCEQNGIKIILNEQKKYTDPQINKMNHLDEYNNIIQERNLLLQQLQNTETRLYDLGIVDFI